MKQVCTENNEDKMYTPYKILKQIAIKGIISEICLPLKYFVEHTEDKTLQIAT